MGRFRHKARRERRDEGRESGGLVGKVVNAVMYPWLESDARDRVAAIEAYRTHLSQSTQEVTYTDYGAGNPKQPRSSEEMSKGRVVTNVVGQVCQRASASPRKAELLLRLVTAVSPRSVLELGTAVGISGAYLAAGLELSGGGGRLVSLEGAESLAQVATNTLKTLGYEADIVVGRFLDTLPEVLEKNGPIGLAYVDGHHDYQATLDYLELLMPSLAERAVLVFDDIAWSDGMRRAWSEIVSDVRVPAVVDTGWIGICMWDPEIAGRLKVKALVH